MIEVGDTVAFRIKEVNVPTSPHEWYDFKDEVDTLYGGQFDIYTWQNVFNKRGTVVRKIKASDTFSVYVVSVDGIGEVKANNKIIRKIFTIPTFRITNKSDIKKL